jgi:hypothetical protein
MIRDRSPRLVRSASALALLGTIVLMMVAGAFIAPRAARSMHQTPPATTRPAAVETGDPHC